MSPLLYAHRNTLIAISVVVMHVLALWAFQTGLLRQAVEVFVPAEVISEFLNASPSKPVPPTPAPAQPTLPQLPQPVAAKLPAPEPLPAATAPAANAPVVVPSVAPSVTPSISAPATPAAAPLNAQSKIEQPSSDAQYLQNPKPNYPAISKRLGEQGKVLVRVLIETDGTAKQAEIRQSSGFERLDKAALTTVLSWRYVPGKRGGVAEAMWFNVPINFVLE